MKYLVYIGILIPPRPRTWAKIEYLSEELDSWDAVASLLADPCDVTSTGLSPEQIDVLKAALDNPTIYMIRFCYKLGHGAVIKVPDKQVSTTLDFS